MDYFTQLDAWAKSTVSSLDQAITRLGVIDLIIDVYRMVCRGGGTEVGLRQMPITREKLLRLRFECLCFTAFIALLISSRFLKNQP
jgi:hypothetical protein